ncbi:MAG: lamin tail domain-containing protein [Chloroflexia bacterium]
MVDTSLRAVGLLPTYTPSPTRSPVPSATPTTRLSPTLRPTATPTTRLSPTLRPTALPTETPIMPQPTKTPTVVPTATPSLVSGPLVIIKAVNKVAEYVDLENKGDQPQDLTGWRLVSEKGNAGVIQPGETLRVWTRNPNGGGYNCGFKGMRNWTPLLFTMLRVC